MPSDPLDPEGQKSTRKYFSSVAAAREALRVRSHEILKLYLANAKRAMKAGDHEVVMKSLQWLMEHAPADEAGQRMVESSVDKVVEARGSTGPTIQLGFNLGGMPVQKALPTVEVIEVKKDDVED